MVSLQFSYTFFSRLVGKTLEPEELEYILNSLGIELEKLEDNTIKVSLEPGRPDLYCGAVGIARAVKLYLELEQPKKYSCRPASYEVQVSPEVEAFRPYTAWAVAKGAEIDEEVLEELKLEQEQLASLLGRKRRKFSIGIYPLRCIAWPVKFVMKRPEEIVFTPLEFSTQLNAKEILTYHPKGKEYGYLLSGLSKYPVFEDSLGRILSLVPIINSEEAGKVVPGDRDIAIEVTGINEYYVQKALDILCCNLQDLGAEIYSVRVIYQRRKVTTPVLSCSTVRCSREEIERTLGLELSVKELLQLLRKMGHEVLFEDGELEVRAPPYRVDIFEVRDIIEDVAIAYGYDNFEPQLPKHFTVGELSFVTKVQKKVRELLTFLGYCEAMTFALTNLADQYSKMRLEVPAWAPKIENAAEKQLNTVRSWILPELLKFLFCNKAKEYPIKVFDVDYVVVPADTETGYTNCLHAALLISDYTVSYTQIRQAVEYLLDRLGVQYSLTAYEHPSFIEGRCAAVLVREQVVGFLGELHPEVLVNFGLEKPVAAAELNLSKIFNL
ncbi:MAG: phenylalanine--tRNA ligase subunit beta [bacterium]|nr:phenylalanine--tRNA ligase subunit beta [bacterium]